MSRCDSIFSRESSDPSSRLSFFHLESLEIVSILTGENADRLVGWEGGIGLVNFLGELEALLLFLIRLSLLKAES